MQPKTEEDGKITAALEPSDNDEAKLLVYGIKKYLSIKST